MKLKPVTLMNDTVGLCKSNINQAVTKLQNTCQLISQAEEVLKQLRRKEMINLEYEMYAHHMDTARNLISKESLKGYKNSSMLTKELETALAEACDAVVKICVEAFGKSHEI